MSYKENYENINWSGGKEYINKKRTRRGKSLQVMSDIEEFISPVDKTLIGSRSGLRNHERRHGIRQIGNDWSGGERTNSAKPADWQQ